MAHVADTTGTSKVEMRSFLSNMLADRRISPEQYVHLMETDNIGDDINKMNGLVGTHKALGTWQRASAIRDPNGSARSLDDVLRTLSSDSPERASSSTRRADTDYDGDAVRNRASYSAAANAPMKVGTAIVASYPHLASAVDAMNNTDGKPGTENEGSRTPEGRAKIMRAEIAKLPKEQRGCNHATFSPLNYGYKGKTRNGG